MCQVGKGNGDIFKHWLAQGRVMTELPTGKHTCTHMRAHEGCGPNPRLHAKRWMALGLVCLICEMGCTVTIKGKGPEERPICAEHALSPLLLQLCTSAPLGSGPESHCLWAPPFNVPACPQQNPPPSPTHLLTLLCSRTPSWDLLLRPPEPGVHRLAPSPSPLVPLSWIPLPPSPASSHCCCCSQLRPG